MLTRSNLKPFLRKRLDILFVGLNPATGSNAKGHYFSVKQSFWKQLFEAGLILENINKEEADVQIFGGNKLNYKKWNYGITDLVNVAESNSRKIKPTEKDVVKLLQSIKAHRPKVVCILHSKVFKALSKYMYDTTQKKLPEKYGSLGYLMPRAKTRFYLAPFPHGNSIPDEDKVKVFKQIRRYLIRRKKSRVPPGYKPR